MEILYVLDLGEKIMNPLLLIEKEVVPNIELGRTQPRDLTQARREHDVLKDGVCYAFDLGMLEFKRGVLRSVYLNR